MGYWWATSSQHLPWDQNSNDMKAFHTITTWTLQKWKPKMMSRVQIVDNDIIEAVIRRVGRTVLLDHFWAKAIESLDGGDGVFLCRKYVFMTVVYACIGTTPKDSRCLSKTHLPQSQISHSQRGQASKAAKLSDAAVPEHRPVRQQ